MRQKSIPTPTVEELFEYLQRTPLEYAYKALLALKLARSQTSSALMPRDSVVEFFYHFYRERNLRGLPLEKVKKVERRIVVDKAFFRSALNMPYKLFHQEGFLYRDSGWFWLWQPLSSEVKDQMERLAFDRLVAHYQEPLELMMEIVNQAEVQQMAEEQEPTRNDSQQISITRL